MNLFQGKYRIKSARASWHNYNDGLYFVTICTANMQSYLGRIESRDVACSVSNTTTQNICILSIIGEFTYKNILEITSHYPYALILESVIMPNHIHLIIRIDQSMNSECNIEAQHEALLPIEYQMKVTADRMGALSIVIRGFKSAITRFANQENICFKWQSRFHEHIIKNQEELNMIAQYVQNNIANWDKDQFNTEKEK